jgi:hypothetical protein
LSYPFALIALIVFVIRMPLLLFSSPLRTFARLRSFGLKKALKKISLTVSENLAGPFSNERTRGQGRVGALRRPDAAARRPYLG